jgi:hypothetical protein
VCLLGVVIGSWQATTGVGSCWLWDCHTRTAGGQGGPPGADGQRWLQVDRAGHWVLTEADVEAMALGAAVLGCGGGGSPHRAKLRVLAEMSR